MIFIFSLVCLLLGPMINSGGYLSISGGLYGWGNMFCFDSVSLYLCLLSIFLFVSLLFISNNIGLLSKGFIVISIVSSVLSYCCAHALAFWVFYEMSILSLLLLVIVESPYSERYIASWYLLGYVVLTSLPMLLCLFYLSFYCGSYNIRFWYDGFNLYSESVGVLAILGVMFITKIPLPPFHVWLPIVHAEASSAVSVCLSGYIMKLGILGVCRFCSHIIPSYIFSNGYILICMSVSVLFFFSATRELDGKRWLAFLSLSHIIIVSVCLCVVGFESSPLAFIFSLGHGLSAGVTFILLWLSYEISGSRNWNILKNCLSSSLIFRCLAASSLCTVASLPPTVQFFSEVYILSESGMISLLFIYMFFVYLFCSGLVPLFFVGGLLSRHYSVELGLGEVWGFISSIFFLVIWSFVWFVIM